MVDHPVAGVRSDLQVVVPDVRAAAGPLTSALLGHPSRQLRMIGVTGTNGKTTTVSFIASLLQANGRTPAVIGTVTGARTTPEAVELQCLLAGAVTRGCTHVVMEVSSHSLVTGRVDGIVFDVAVFTNLGRDHLDFHGSVDDYFAAKARLFGADRCVRAVVNADDASDLESRRGKESARANWRRRAVRSHVCPDGSRPWRPTVRGTSSWTTPTLRMRSSGCCRRRGTSRRAA